MGDSALPRRRPSLEHRRVERIEDLGPVRDLVASARLLLVELTPDDGAVDELDDPLHAIADRYGRELIPVEHQVVIRSVDDADAAASMARAGLTRIDACLSDPSDLRSAIRIV